MWVSSLGVEHHASCPSAPPVNNSGLSSGCRDNSASNKVQKELTVSQINCKQKKKIYIFALVVPTDATSPASSITLALSFGDEDIWCGEMSDLNTKQVSKKT